LEEEEEELTYLYNCSVISL